MSKKIYLPEDLIDDAAELAKEVNEPVVVFMDNPRDFVNNHGILESEDLDVLPLSVFNSRLQIAIVKGDGTMTSVQAVATESDLIKEERRAQEKDRRRS
jgi:hypothetical protein